MTRIAQPREVAELKGAHKHDPQRYRKTPAKSEFQLGQPRADMKESEKEVWFELETYAAKGVLTGGDRMILEVTCALMAEFRSDRWAFSAAKIGQLVGCLARLGLTPSDRQKIGVEKPKDADDFGQF